MNKLSVRGSIAAPEAAPQYPPFGASPTPLGGRDGAIERQHGKEGSLSSLFNAVPGGSGMTGQGSAPGPQPLHRHPAGRRIDAGHRQFPGQSPEGHASEEADPHPRGAACGQPAGDALEELATCAGCGQYRLCRWYQGLPLCVDGPGRCYRRRHLVHAVHAQRKAKA